MCTIIDSMIGTHRSRMGYRAWVGPMTERRVYAIAAILPCLAACSSADSSSAVVLPSFKDVFEAPQAIQSAAEAVVRIHTAGSYGTGAFISPTGMLLTNNHVLGVDVCPREGCYAQITFMHQRRAAVQPPQTVFVVPVAIDVGLDMAAMQVSTAPGASPLDTPHYLTLASRDPASLRGARVHVVGHPEATLKKWSTGQVVDSDGTWIWFTAFSLPGSSGSPVLDDDGHMVGILHRGPTSQDLVTNSGIAEYAIGTASRSLIQAMTAPLPAALRSTLASTTEEDVVLHQAVYLNAHAENAVENGVPTQVLVGLGAKCDAGLARQDYASPDDLTQALAPCVQAERWVECRSDAPQGGFGVCPQNADTWLQRFQGVYDHWLALNGELILDMVSFAPAALASSQAQGMSTGAQKLTGALAAAGAPLDFGIANYLAAFDVGLYAGTSIFDFVRNYSKSNGYALSATSIASAALWLNHDGKLSGDDTKTLLRALASDNNVPLGTKLYVEDVLYQSGALD